MEIEDKLRIDWIEEQAQHGSVVIRIFHRSKTKLFEIVTALSPRMGQGPGLREAIDDAQSER
jgi:hypothetical protein